MCMRFVDDLQALCKTICRDAFEFNFALSTLAHSTRKHGPKVIGTCCQYAFVHIESFGLNEKTHINNEFSDFILSKMSQEKKKRSLDAFSFNSD